MSATYKVRFLPGAKKRFERLGTADQRQLTRKFLERSRNPRVPGDKLSKMPNCYKIKLRASGIRAVYLVQDRKLVILVLAVGGREGGEAYDLAERELRKLDG